jgi:Immunity protein Imm1
MLYFPSDYAGTGSLHSVGDPVARDRDDWSPALTFYYFTHHSEFPKWMAYRLLRCGKAVRSFVRSGGKLPSNIVWKED